MRGFSLVEVVAVLVVAIAIHVHRSVLRRAQTQVAERSLATVVAEVWVLAAYGNDVH